MSRCYTQITLADRRRLHHLVAAKVPVSEMARRLGRHRSTIYREIKRNTFRDRELPDYDGYYSTVANDIAQDRRRRLKKLRRHPNLRTEIINQLEACWSPEQIAGRLLSDGLSRVRVCKENGYQKRGRKPRTDYMNDPAVIAKRLKALAKMEAAK
ncbi:IS30 family transposase [Rhizobium leguminosarum]|nr:IS30 family transposase [Rhizobium leguminosarum]